MVAGIFLVVSIILIFCAVDYAFEGWVRKHIGDEDK